MKWLIFLLSFSMYSQVEVIQINAAWNKSNDLNLHLKNCEYSYTLLESQPKHIQSKIKSVPTIIILKDGRAVRQYQANISLRLNITEEEIQNYINSLNGK